MAGTAIPINRENCTLEELDRVKLSSQSLKDYSRLEAIWFLYRGYLRKEVEELPIRKTLWVYSILPGNAGLMKNAMCLLGQTWLRQDLPPAMFRSLLRNPKDFGKDF